MICVDGEERTAGRPVIDLGASQKEAERAAAPVTPAQQQMGGAPNHPMQVDIGPPPTTPRPKREAGGDDQNPTKHPNAASTSQDEPTNGQLMQMLQQLLTSQNETNQYVGHITTRIDQTDEMVTGLENAYRASDLDTKNQISNLAENTVAQGNARTAFEQKLTGWTAMPTTSSRQTTLPLRTFTRRSLSQVCLATSTTTYRERLPAVRWTIGLGKSLLSGSGSSSSTGGQAATIEAPYILGSVGHVETHNITTAKRFVSELWATWQNKALEVGGVRYSMRSSLMRTKPGRARLLASARAV